MSLIGQASDHTIEASGAVLVGAITLDPGAGYPSHQHGTHQLAWASTGLLTMGVAGRTYVLPRARALWIPAGVLHQVTTGGETRFVSLYFDPEACPVGFADPTVIDSTGLLGHLMDHLSGRLAEPARHRAEAVLFDLIRPTPAVELTLPTVQDDRLRRLLDALQRRPDDPRTLEEWGRELGASSRTLARAIRRDTGMTFSAWRTHLRMAAALALLARAVPVTQVAIQVGYATPSAFVAAFKRTLGTTPGQYTASTKAC